MDSLPSSIAGDKEAMAETIENNVRRLIIDEMAVNPKYYEKMSELLDALIEQRRKEALDYKEYLQRIVELTRQTANQGTISSYPAGIDTPALRAFYDNLDQDVHLAIRLDDRIRAVKRADWRDNKFKTRELRRGIEPILMERAAETGGFDIDEVMDLVKAQDEY